MEKLQAATQRLPPSMSNLDCLPGGTLFIKVLDREHLTVRAAHDRTGAAAADFSRIRNADLGRFTVDRLMSIINRLGSRVEVEVRVRRAEAVDHKATA
ncbi:MAG: XRE family transcriptional regulator [Acidobacteria bacterium]|nr:XRE family transcriptional regulator [Acidobacteriota bacterium]